MITKRRSTLRGKKSSTGASNNSKYILVHTYQPSSTTSPCHTCSAFCDVQDILDNFCPGTGGRFFKVPEPELHKVILSWKSRQKLYPDFAEEFGEPKHFPKGYEFPNRLFLSRYSNRSGRYIVRFNATTAIFTGLWNIINKNECPFGAVQLNNVEAAWNFPFPDLTYGAVEALLLTLARNSLPRFSHARLWLVWGKRRRNKDGTENGRVTAYFQQLRRRKGEHVGVKKPGWKLKAYAKEIDGVWNIHIEVTLGKRFLTNNGLAKDIPTSASPVWLSMFPLESFLNFSSFCMRKVIGALPKTRFLKKWNKIQSTANRRYKSLHPYHVRLSAARVLPACEQKRLARKIAESVGARGLTKRIDKGEYDCPCRPPP